MKSLAASVLVLLAAAGCAAPASDSSATTGEGMSAAQGARLVDARIAKDAWLGTASGDKLVIGRTVGQRVVGGNFIQYDPSLLYGLVVANGPLQAAFLVRTGFLELYQGGLAEDPANTRYLALGAPLEDEHSDGVHVAQQRYTYGYMLWFQQPWHGEVRMAQDVAQARAGDASIGWARAFLGGYRAVVYDCGTSIAAYEAWVVVNPTADATFVVKDDILEQYEGAAQTLGLPTAEEANGSQTFENGTLSVSSP